MIAKIGLSYEAFDNPATLPREFTTGDHLGGFALDGGNDYFDKLDSYAASLDQPFVIHSGQIFDDVIRNRYSNLDFRFSVCIFEDYAAWNHFSHHHQHPDKQCQALLSSFNGSAHVSRKLLVAAIHRWGWYDPRYVSKNFSFTVDELDGHISDYVMSKIWLYRKLFIGPDSAGFFHSQNSFAYSRNRHGENIKMLEHRLSSTFLNLVSETMATSMRPYITEKFLYSVITRGLFMAYAQPGWHRHLEHYYGFRMFNRIFDYGFDDIANPVERLVNIMSQISRFSIMTPDDWQDLYEVEHETIEFNHDHYFSGNYVRHLQKHFDPESGIYVNTHHDCA